MPSNDKNNSKKGGFPDFMGGLGNSGNKNGNKRNFSWSFIYLIITAVLIGVYFFSSNEVTQEVNDMEFY